MFSLFSKKKAEHTGYNFVDLDGLPLKEGDLVNSYRYELGKCRIIRNESGMAYQSIDSGKIVSWSKMIDASTKNQKVKKIL